MPYLNFDNIAIKGIATALPENVVKIDAFESDFGKERITEFKKKTGISSVNRALMNQTASDLGYEAANVLFNFKVIDKEQIGFIIFISKTPDYRSPATATVLHNRLAFSRDCIAFDVNLGGAGFIYGLQIGCSMLESINKNYGLLIVGDTTSKQISFSDPAMMIFGDGSSAILLEKRADAKPVKIETGSEGEKFRSFYIPGGGFRTCKNSADGDLKNNKIDHALDELIIGSDFYSFELSEMPAIITKFMDKHNTSWNNYDFFAIPQITKGGTNDFMNKELIPHHKYLSVLSSYGDTCGNSIPLILTESFGTEEGVSLHILSAGYGEGISWGVADFYINTGDIIPVIKTDLSYEEGEVSHDFK